MKDTITVAQLLEALKDASPDAKVHVYVVVIGERWEQSHACAIGEVWVAPSGGVASIAARDSIRAR